MSVIWLVMLAVSGSIAQDLSMVLQNYCFDPQRPELTLPYVASTLEPDTLPADPASHVEPLVVRLDAVDCTTLVEYVTAALLAQAPMPDAQDSLFLHYLQSLRYRGGIRGNYATRKHYFSEWISDGEAQGLLDEVTASLPGSEPLHQPLYFMTRNVRFYPQLQACHLLQQTVREVEERLSAQTLHYIPSAQIHRAYPQLQHGDIVAFVTDTPGLDVQHVGFVWRPDAKATPQLLHASSARKCVTLDDASLEDYALRVRHCIGIRIVRLLHQRGLTGACLQPQNR